MGIRSQMIGQAKQLLQRSASWKSSSSSSSSSPSSSSADRVPKGYLPVYVGESEKRFVVPVSYLRHPSFKSLLKKAEEEYGFDNRMGGIRVPCHEDAFLNLTLQME